MKILLREEGLNYQSFMGQLVITSYKEDELHYQLFKGQSLMTSYKE
jgi:hypothetical protein